MTLRSPVSADVVLLMLPHWGIVDSWLPVLSELRQKKADISISAILPTTNNIMRLQRDDFLVDLCNVMFDSVIYGQMGEYWRESHTFEQAMRVYKSSDSIRKLSSSPKIVLFDIILEERQIVRELQQVMAAASWFSLPHGIDPRATKLDRRKSSGKIEPKMTVYAASRAEAESYQRLYGLKGKDVKVVGVPRHSTKWLNKLFSYYRDELPNGDFIFLASRPASEKLFPRDSKVQALNEIKGISEELKCKLIIRLHPLEGDDDRHIFEEVFGRAACGETWSYSSLPSMLLGSHALFAITFFSSVAVDMLAIGTPVIERFDFSGLSGSRNLILDSQGRLTSVYQGFGLARGASNFNEFREQVAAILTDREGIVVQLKDAYDRIYESSPDAVDLIVQDILEVLEHPVS